MDLGFIEIIPKSTAPKKITELKFLKWLPIFIFTPIGKLFKILLNNT